MQNVKYRERLNANSVFFGTYLCFCEMYLLNASLKPDE